MTSVAASRHSGVLARDSDATVVIVRDGVEVASWPLPSSDRPDLALVHGLARMQLAARRLGCSVQLRHPSARLLELLELVGLGDVVPPAAALPGEVGREPEGGEQVGVEEVVVPDDPVA